MRDKPNHSVFHNQELMRDITESSGLKDNEFIATIQDAKVFFPEKFSLRGGSYYILVDVPDGTSRWVPTGMEAGLSLFSSIKKGAVMLIRNISGSGNSTYSRMIASPFAFSQEIKEQRTKDPNEQGINDATYEIESEVAVSQEPTRTGTTDNAQP